MNSMRTQAELYYSSNINSYASICTTAQTSLGFGGTGGPGLLKAVKDSSMSGTPNTDIATPGAWNLVTCHDSATAWAVEAPLSTSTSGSPIMFCVDNLKAPKQETTNLTINTGAHPYDCQ